MENSRNKQFLSFTFRFIVSSVMKSPDIPLCPTMNMNHPFLQHLHVVCYPPMSHLAAIELSDLLSLYHSAYIQVNFVLLHNVPKEQE